jgi:hypothetical protein
VPLCCRFAQPVADLFSDLSDNMLFSLDRVGPLQVYN